MKKPTHLFKPDGKDNKTILHNTLQELHRILTVYEDFRIRHADEISKHHSDTSQSRASDLDLWIERSALNLLFEHCEPEKFDYDFHVLRKNYLDSIEIGEEPNIGEIFTRLCAISGIGGLLNSIWSARLSLETIYAQPLHPREVPRIDLYSMDCLELDAVNLRLYSAASQFYGPDAFLALMEGSASLKTEQHKQRN